MTATKRGKPRPPKMPIQLRDRGPHNRKKRAARALVATKKTDPVANHILLMRRAIQLRTGMTKSQYLEALIWIREELNAEIKKATTDYLGEASSKKRPGFALTPKLKRPKFTGVALTPKSKRHRLTGAIVSGTDPCICGHPPEEHGHDPEHPGSTACQSDSGSDVPEDGCDCVAYEADPEGP